MDDVRPAVRTGSGQDVLTTSRTTTNIEMIRIQLILLALANNLTARADNNFQFLNFDLEEEDDFIQYPEYSGVSGEEGGFNGSFIERTNRRNEYVPFNSLTLGEGKEAGASPAFSSKFKFKNKDKIKNKNKVEWWEKKKKNKKKKKTPPKSPSQKVRTTRTTARTTEATTTKLTTWFPSRQPTTSSYFSRPLDYQRPLAPLAPSAHKVFLDTLGTEHQYLMLTSLLVDGGLSFN